MIKKASFIFIVIALGVLATGCGPSCDVNGYVETMESHMEAWANSTQEADALESEDLSEAIAELEAVKRDIEALEVDPCMEEAHGYFVSFIGSMIDAYSAIMDGDVELAEEHVAAADAYFAQYESTLESLME